MKIRRRAWTKPLRSSVLFMGSPSKKKAAMGIATKAVQRDFEKIAANPASIGDLKGGWLIPNPNLGNYGTDYKLRAGIAFVGFGANLPQDGYYPLLVQDSK